MWTYSPDLLSTWPESEELADILWPMDDSPPSEPGKSSLLERFGLTPKDLKNKRIRTMLESGWPQVVDSMYILAWLRRPDIPFYQIRELCQHLTAFGEYLRSCKDSIISYGRPSKSFEDSPWLDAGLSNLYPFQSVISQTCGEEHGRILREEVLRIKIDVVEFLAKQEALRLEDPKDISDQALHLVRGRHLLQRLRECEKLEEAHLREQSRMDYPKETSCSGGYADVIGLIAFFEKERVLGTFRKAKARLVELLPRDNLMSYVKISRPSLRALVDQVIGTLRSDLDAEEDFIREFFARAQISEEVARIRRTEGIERDYIFIFTRDHWRIRWSGGETFHFRDLKGLKYIAYLLRFTDQEISVSRLYQYVNPPMRNRAEQWGSGIEATDQRTIDRVKARNAEIKRLLASGPTVQQRRRLRDELRRNTHYLSSCSNLHGKPRLTGDTLTKMRVNVTNNITNAKKKLRSEIPGLAEHLDRYLHTGSTCSYAPPSDAIRWTL